MFEIILGLSILTAIIMSLFLIPLFMRFFSKIDVVGIDQQKFNKPFLPTSGGIPLFVAFLFSSLLAIFLTTFIFPNHNFNNTKFLAALLSIGIITMIGFFDDIYVRRTLVLNRSDTLEKRIGLKQWLKPFLTFFAAIPLMVVAAGVSSVTVPFIGIVNFGILYPLILIPIAVVSVSNATNMLAGFNGLESGLMIITSFFLGLFAFFNNQLEGTLLSFLLCAVLLIFLKFNWFPARFLPGDSLTYFIGGVFVSSVILGNIEKFGIFIFMLWIVEVILKLRGGFNVRSFGDLQEDGTIKCPYKKVYSITHIIMLLPEWFNKKRFTEKQIVLIILFFQLLISLLVFLFYSSSQYF